MKEPERSGCHNRAIMRLFNPAPPDGQSGGEASGKKVKPKT